MSGEAPTAEPFLPERRSLKALREASASCRGCPLHADATQTVFGAGRASARMVLVGEQPGDREDREGKPFVGPAGRVLDEALVEAGIERSEVYVTNAVKHFKWRQGRGKRRLHQRPAMEEIHACRPWLEAELAAIAPELVIGLGATAARALLGTAFRVTRDRGTFVESDLAPLVTATVHPSSLLRIDDAPERALATAEFTRDLAEAARRVGAG
jgi:uracil-DNA glycosylase family protein